MSRLLANYYLHTFDVQFIEQIKTLFTQERGINYQYTRFADDLWIAFRGGEDLSYKITQIVSQLLSDLGLHLNEAKTKIFNSDDYYKYWCFSEWEVIQDNSITIEVLYDYLVKLYKEKIEDTRWFTPFHYGIKKVITNKEVYEKLAEEELEWIIDIVLENPNFISRNNKTFEEFIEKTIKKYPVLKEKVISYIDTKKACYPVVVFSLLNILSKVKEDESISRLMEKEYFKPQWRDLFWFNRCIALRYISENSNYYKINKRSFLEKVVKHIDSISEYLNGIERRYAIKFLVSLPNLMGADIISKKFSLSEDTYLVEYLKKA